MGAPDKGDKGTKIFILLKKLINVVICVSFLAANAFGDAFRTPGTEVTLLIVALSLCAIIYVGTAMTKNIICRCFRCPGFDPNSFAVRTLTAVLTQVV